MNSMTPSVESQKEITEGQINKAIANYRMLLEKHAPQFSADATQQVLGDPAFAAEQYSVFQRRMETISGLIVRRVAVNRSRTPQQAIDATGRNKYLTNSAVASMPQGNGEEVDVFFFKLDRYTSDDDLDKEYELRGLKPADPYALAAVNEVDPAFADDHPNSTHWKDENSNWCYIAFSRWHGERDVGVLRDDRGWHAYWWFAGCRK